MNSNYEDYKRSNGGNTLGLVGFIFSIICCPIPIGLILSLIALKNSPKGFAIAGTIIGSICTLGVVSAVFQYKTAYDESNCPDIPSFIELNLDVVQILGLTSGYVDQENKYPEGLDDLPIADKQIRFDPWGTEYNYTFTTKDDVRSYHVTSAGPDKVFGNEDDPTLAFSSIPVPMLK